MSSATHRQDSTDTTRRAVHGTCPPACSVCPAVRAEIENALKYLENAPHAEFARVNVIAFARSVLNMMDQTQNRQRSGTAGAGVQGGAPEARA